MAGRGGGEAGFRRRGGPALLRMRTLCRFRMLMLVVCWCDGCASALNQKVHLEVGANNATKLVKHCLEQQYTDLYLFEPNPIWANHYQQLARQVASQLKIIHMPYAAWIRNETLVFHTHDNFGGVGSTLFNNSIYLVKTRQQIPNFGTASVKIEAIDFADWMSRTLTGDTITARIDAEGAEYVLMRSLLLSGQVCRFKQFVFEGHALYHESHAQFRMLDVLIPWLVQGCPEPRPDVMVERYYGPFHVKKRYGKVTGLNKHNHMLWDKRIEWSTSSQRNWCSSCQMMVDIVNPEVE